MLTRAHYTVIYAGLASDGFFSTVANPPQIDRLYGRKFRGVGADHGAQPDGSVTGGSWLQSFETDLGTVTEWDYYEDQSWDVSVADSKLARSSVSRTSGGEIAIGHVMASLNDSGAGLTAWGGYSDAVRAVAGAGNTIGHEVNCGNMVAALTPATPYAEIAGEIVGSVRLGAGSDAAIFGNSYAINTFAHMVDNGAKALTGIVVEHNAILRDDQADTPGVADGVGYARFASLGYNIGVSWWSKDPASTPGTQAEVVKLTSTVEDPAVKWRQTFTDTAVIWGDDVDPDNNAFVINYSATLGAGIGIVPADVGDSPSVAAIGTNTDINLTLAPKGTGVMAIPIANVPEYADDAAAAVGGLSVGSIYRTASALKIRVS